MALNFNCQRLQLVEECDWLSFHDIISACKKKISTYTEGCRSVRTGQSAMIFSAGCPYCSFYKVSLGIGGSLYHWELLWEVWGESQSRHDIAAHRYSDCSSHNTERCFGEIRAPLEFETIGGEKHRCCLPWDAGKSRELGCFLLFLEQARKGWSESESLRSSWWLR